MTNVATGTGTGTIVAASGGTVYIPARVPTAHAITAISQAYPTVITCADAVLDGSVVVISGSNSVPCVDGTWTAHYIDSTHFSINANVLTAGNAGSALIPDAAAGETCLRVMEYCFVARGASGTGAGVVLNLQDTSGVVVGYAPVANLVKDTPTFEWSASNTAALLRTPLTAGAGLEVLVSGGTLATLTSIDVIVSYETK